MAPSVQVEGEAPVKLSAPEELSVTTPEPLPMLEVEVLLKVVKAPVLAVVAPIAVELMPVEVVLKLLEVMFKTWAPSVQVESKAPVRLSAPEELSVTTPEPLPMLLVPVELNVVKAPEAAVVAPIWVALIPVAVVLKVEAPVPEVMVRALVP